MNRATWLTARPTPLGARINSLFEVRGPLLRDHGVLAPNAKLRAPVVPTGPVCTQRQRARISWARLLKRVFEIDLEDWPHCGGQLKIISAILESAVIERMRFTDSERCPAKSCHGARNQRLNSLSSVQAKWFSITGHRTNYVLPHTCNGNADFELYREFGDSHKAKNYEIEYQFSLKTPL